jgi:predicted transcriptional regulator
MRRSKNEMKTDILRCLLEGDAQRTHLSEKLNIKPITVFRCLQGLRKAGLISKNGWIYSITAKGREISEMAEKVREALNANSA